MAEFSVSPAGEKFSIPKEEEYTLELERINKLVEEQRATGREIVVVMGMGFVGSVMAAIVADTVDEKGKPSKFVIGVQRPSVRSYWKVPVINRGDCPVKSEDPEVAPMIERCVVEKKTFIATYHYDVLKLADVVVIDIQCDFQKTSIGECRTGHTEMRALEAAFGIIAERIPEKCLVLIETTVPPGTTENVAFPIMKKIFKKRGLEGDPLLAHSYERVMPGKDYVKSIRDFWRVCSGVNQDARNKVEKFLTQVLNTEEFPLTVLDKPIESETAKIVENSWRATILAFMDEWSTFAERNGVDLIKVVDAIKVRPTHNNMIFPGPGIGGYCLPKDGALGWWAYKHILGFDDDIFKITTKAIDINDTRSLRAADKVRDALRNMGTPIAAADVLVMGASYREDVGDTRYSGSELMIRKLCEMGAEIRVHDPYVDQWHEFETQEDDPHSKAQYFWNQSKLIDLNIEKDLEVCLKGAYAVVFAVRHDAYMDIDPDWMVKKIGRTAAIIDCFGILDDEKIEKYFELGCEVKGLGRGHIQRIKDKVRKARIKRLEEKCKG